MNKYTKIALIPIILAVAFYAYTNFFNNHTIYTDNAYLKADILPVSPKVNGYIQEIPFKDNELVSQGQILFKIESADYNNIVIMKQNDLISAEANLLLAKKDLDRARKLSKDDYVSQKMVDQSENKLTEAQSTVEKLKADLSINQNKAYDTSIKAPFNGYINNRSVALGQYVAPGQALAYLVSADDIWVEANFKETQLKDLKPGQKVIIGIDALKGQEFKAVVDSISKATGADFSILPPENATGNFTKIVRRVPVKIKFEAGQDLSALRSGLSAEVTVTIQ